MQEFIFCIVPLVFQISFNAELPLAMNILHSLLEDFLWHYYYSKAYSGLFKFLEHARQFRNSAVKLSASVIFKKSLAKLKGPGFELECSAVPFRISNSKAPKKRRANVLEVTMDDKKNFETCWKNTKM